MFRLQRASHTAGVDVSESQIESSKVIKRLFMSFCPRSILWLAVSVVTISAEANLAFSGSLPSGSNTSVGNPSSTNKYKSKSTNQESDVSGSDNAATKTNLVLFENYQACYATLISDVVGRPLEEFEARKLTIKKYCRGIVNVKKQKKFSECFSAAMNRNVYTSNSDIDSDIINCTIDNDK